MDSGISFSEKENRCHVIFTGAGKFWHISTPEDYEIIFRNDDDFKAGMTILAICTALFPDARIVTFILMNNHIHMVVLAEYQKAKLFFDFFKKTLFRHFKKIGRVLDPDSFNPDIREVKDLDNLRNAISYDNRNAFVVNPYCTPMTYKWGAGNYYFNPDSQQRWKDSKCKLTGSQIREVAVSRQMDAAAGMIMVDGYVCPMSFCSIDLGESMFRDPAHYFNKISKSVEAYREFAKEIGERIFYTDDDLFSVVNALSRSLYGPEKITLLSAANKVDLAKKMHYDYNASNKQIIRMLKLDESVVNALFPKRMP